MQETCDIIIPVWNHLSVTAGCVSSIKKHTNFPHRIIIVDNASDIQTRRYLDSIKEENPAGAVVIRNDENKGFVKAVNQGMEFSDAKYVCILNNDTVVTEGWLSEMVGILREENTIGIVNPSSNTFCQFPGKLDIDSYAGTLKGLTGKYQELYAARAFAMVVKREIVEKVGYLDDTYGMGYYDDIDYSKRTQKCGYTTVRAKASYVHHKVSQSFSSIKERSKIFMDNEKKFISKWGRQLRVAYVLPGAPSAEEIDKISGNINRIAKSGHQAWVFTTRRLGKRLNLIDHESIRLYCYPPAFFSPVVFYKIWKRKKKKKLHLILSGDKRMVKLLTRFRKSLGADALLDNNFEFFEKKMQFMSFV